MINSQPFKFFNRYKWAYSLLPERVERILDFGCNDGYFIWNLKQKAEILFGVDVDGKAIEKAKRNYKNINFYKIDVDDIFTIR